MMMPFRVLSALFCVASLAACGGGGGPILVEREDLPVPDDRVPSVSGETAPENQTPSSAADPEDPFEVFGTETPEAVQSDGSALDETLAETGAETILLTGVAIVVDEATGDRTIVRRDGVFTAADDSRTLGGEPLELTDDVPGAFVVTSSFVQETNGAVGVVGVATDVADMPTTGSATLTGGAVGFVITGDAGVRLANGQSTVTADFTNTSVDVELGNFTGISQVSGNLVDAPFDGLSLTGATIADTGFSGGMLTTIGGASLSDVLGANANVQSEGQFYGFDSGEATPSEVGGLIYADGESGQIFTSFIAD